MIQVVRRSIVDIYNLYSFSRGSLAYDSKGKLYHLHNARFEPGKFGQAIMVEEGTTNLVKNPCASSDLTYWYLNRNADSVASMTRITNDGVFGSTCVEFTRTTLVSPGWIVFQQMLYQYLSSPYFDTTKQYTLSFWARSVAGSNVLTVSIRDPNGSNVVLDHTTVNLTSGWQKYVITFTPLISGNQPVLYLTVGSDNTTFRITAVQLEAKPYATSFIDGTRAAETLTIPTAGVLNPQEGTIEFIFIPSHKDLGGVWRRLFDWGQVWSAATPPTNHDFHLTRNPSNFKNLALNVQQANVGSAGAGVTLTNDITPGNPYYVAIRYKFTGNSSTGFISLSVFDYVNNEFKTATTATALVPDLQNRTFALGANVNNTSQGNCLFDDLRFSSIARSDEEILAAYQSGQPLPVDADTTLKLNFDGPDTQRAAKVLVV